MIGLREERGPELGQIDKVSSNLKAEVPPANELSTVTTILRRYSLRRSILQVSGPMDHQHEEMTDDERKLCYFNRTP